MNGPSERCLKELQPNLAPEEACLFALLDLNDFQEMGPGKAVNAFYSAFSSEEAPEDLRTRIDTHPVEQNPQDSPHHLPQKSYVEGFEIVATVIVGFYAREAEIREMLDFDFVKTEEGLRIMQRELSRQGEAVVMQYTRVLNEEEMMALARDAVTIQELVVEEDAVAIQELVAEEDAELMNLGPLMEEQSEDGTRRFHIGDVLSITTGQLVSPRGIDGIRDILSYMTDDNPYTTQLGRFAEECLPYLEEQLGEAIRPYSEVPASIKDNLSLYKWLHGVTKGMKGDPFLEVGKIRKGDHAVMDSITETELDYGTRVTDKFTQIDPSSFGQDEE